MSKAKYVLYLIAVVMLCWQAVEPGVANSGNVLDGCNFIVTSSPGVVLVCPLGDGDPLTARVGGGSSQITLTVRDNTHTGIPGIPATDMWLVGCNDGLLLCGASQGSSPDGPTNGAGVTTFSNEPVSGGCDTGFFVVVEGVVATNPVICTVLCVPIAARSPDYKSAGAPGPAPCAGDIRCPDSRISNADFSWFVTHYPTGANPAAPYLACADFAAPLASITLADFSKFSVHFAGAGHKCPI